MDGWTHLVLIACWNGTKISLVGNSGDTQESLRHVRCKDPLGPWLPVVARPRGISRH